MRPNKPIRPGLLAVAIAAFALTAGCSDDDGVDETLRTPSESMQPTYAVGDRLQVDLEPESVGRGDVVIAHPPLGAETNTCGVQHSERTACPRPTPERAGVRLVKRIVGISGDRLKVEGGAVYIDGERQEEPYANLGSCVICDLPGEIQIPRGHVFLMGDNRPASSDSREWGPVPARWIIGVVVGIERRADEEGPRIEAE